MACSATLLSSCINDDDYSVPTLSCTETSLVKNLEPQAVPAASVVAPYSGPAGGIIEAYVVSSDLGGNFFKSISLQTLDGSFGFSIPVDITTVFTKFEPGRKVLIKLDGTYTDIKFGSMRIGALYQGEVGRLSATQYETILNRSCTVVSEEDLVQNLTIAQTLNNARINTLIELQNVQFKDESVNKTYYDANNQIGGATNHILVDQNGGQIIFRTSSFASYAGSIVPGKSGTVRGVLTKFNNDYQFVARTEDDIKLINPRIGEEPTNPGQPGGSEFALGGTETAFLGAFTENFESYAVNATTFPKYVNDHITGDRYWQLKQFPANTGNKYIEMTSFSGNTNPGIAAKTYFFVPADFTAANTFSFSKEIRYMQGAALKVYYVTSANYTARGAINVNNFVDITSSFTGLTYPATGQSQNNFTTAGTYTIPASLTGTGFFVFEYTGSATVTTTIQLDDIVIN